MVKNRYKRKINEMNQHQPPIPTEHQTLVDILRWRALHQPNQRAYTFLLDGEKDQVHITYSELDQKARAIGAWLQEMEAAGERALLLYPSGLEFIAAFFGCLYAGTIAVPSYPPRRNRLNSRLEAIVKNSQPIVGLSNAAHVEPHPMPELADMEWLITDHIVTSLGSEWEEPTLSADTLAFLQYTSGSTNTPKGVMLSHRNLLHNLSLIQGGFGATSSSRGVIWLPLYHDMGLIGGVLEPLYIGAPTTIMSPVAFLQKPLRWLQAISRYRATISGGPNFAYEYCVEKISPKERERLRKLKSK